MEKLDSGQLARRVIILLYLSGGATLETAIPNREKNKLGSFTVFVTNGSKYILEIFEDEFDFLLEDKLIEISCGSGEDPKLNYFYTTYVITEEAWDRMKAIREKIIKKKQKTA